MPTPLPQPPAQRPLTSTRTQIHRWLAVVTSQSRAGRAVSAVTRRGHAGEDLISTSVELVPCTDAAPQNQFAVHAFHTAYAEAEAAREPLYVTMRIDAVMTELRALETSLPWLRLVEQTSRGSVSEHIAAEAYQVGLDELESAVDDNTPSVLVATDASMRTGTRGVGIAAVSGDGRAFLRYRATCGDILAGELNAMILALREYPERNIIIESDSLHGVELANIVLGTDTSATGRLMSSTLSTQVKRALARIEALRYGRQVTIRWVQGHSDNALNNAADRLAVLARRTRGGQDTSAATSTSIARNILSDYLAPDMTGRPVLRAA